MQPSPMKQKLSSKYTGITTLNTKLQKSYKTTTQMAIQVL